MSDLYSRPYNPNPDRCCAACVFGGPDHAEWCTAGWDDEGEAFTEAQLDRWVEQWVEP